MNSSLLKDIQETAAQLRLPTIAREGGQAFLKAGQLGALDTFFEVLMMEIEERKERRVERIEAARDLQQPGYGPLTQTSGILSTDTPEERHQESSALDWSLKTREWGHF